MRRLNWFNNRKINSYCPPEKPESMEKIVDKLWDITHIIIIPNLIMQDSKIDEVNRKNTWQMVLLGLLLVAMSTIIGLCINGRFD